MYLATYIADEHNVILPHTADLLWGTVSFLVVALLMYKLAWPTLTRTLDERTEKIDNGLNAAAHAREEIDAERIKLQDEKEDAMREAASIREKAQANASDIVADAQKTATAEAKRINEANQRQIAADADSARRELRNDVGALAGELAAKIVGAQAADPEVSQKVIDNFLDELEAATSSKEA